MGDRTVTKSSYDSAINKHISSGQPSTTRGFEEVRNTGKLHPLVDPSGYDVIRRSLIRLDPQPNGLFLVTVGPPIEHETRLDTTGSMGRNVEVAIKVLPHTYDLSSKMLPGSDLQLAIGIFGDCQDSFVLCRPQFEMTSDKLVEQLTLMVPEGLGGGNGGEDPQYGLFGAAYLTSSYNNRIGLKGYDFTISDEPARERLDERQLKRVFGDEVFRKTTENGFEINHRDLPSTKEVVKDLLKRSHAFFLEAGQAYSNTHSFWVNMFGEERIVVLPEIDILPHVQAVIIGLTEGTISTSEVIDFLIENGIGKENARIIARSVSNIPIGAQAELRRKVEQEHRIPKKGDYFRAKTDLWPIDLSEVPQSDGTQPTQGGINWL